MPNEQRHFHAKMFEVYKMFFATEENDVLSLSHKNERQLRRSRSCEQVFAKYFPLENERVPWIET